MKKIIYRFAIVLTALAVGILLVASLSYVGNESSGPVEDFLSKVKNVVANLEEDYILKKPLGCEWFSFILNHQLYPP